MGLINLDKSILRLGNLSDIHFGLEVLSRVTGDSSFVKVCHRTWTTLSTTPSLSSRSHSITGTVLLTIDWFMAL